MAADDLTLTLRLPRALRESLDVAAERESRSVNSFVALLLAEHMKRAGLLDGDARAGRGRRPKPATRRR